ncbi:irs-1, partial [Symbiodinium sp. KB8]
RCFGQLFCWSGTCGVPETQKQVFDDKTNRWRQTYAKTVKKRNQWRRTHTKSVKKRNRWLRTKSVKSGKRHQWRRTKSGQKEPVAADEECNEEPVPAVKKRRLVRSSGKLLPLLS